MIDLPIMGNHQSPPPSPPPDSIFKRDALVGAFFNPWTRRGLLRAHSLWRQCARACFLVVATLCAFSALRYLPLTEFTSITFSSPLIVALIAGPLLGEWIGIQR